MTPQSPGLQTLSPSASHTCSHAGVITSIDDFYIVNPTNLVVLETTNDIYDTSLYEAVSYRSALSYHRVYAANLVAQDGAQWAQLAQVRARVGGGAKKGMRMEGMRTQPPKLPQGVCTPPPSWWCRMGRSGRSWHRCVIVM